MKPSFFDFDTLKNFPNPELASPQFDYCLGVGGDLSVPRLLEAYRKGIFPWYSVDGLVHWFCPHPRCVLYPHEVHVSRSMQRLFNKNYFRVTYDKNFSEVIRQCANVNRNSEQNESWITADFIEGYTNLYAAGYAHSVEVWKDEKIVGGMYGVSIGACFFGESMFSLENNASKYGLISLAQKLQQLQFAFIDCQVPNPHLLSLGARNISRKKFLDELKNAVRRKTIIGSWDSL